MGYVGLYCWFSHDVTKIQTAKLSILLRFYFHDVLEQLKTKIHISYKEYSSDLNLGEDLGIFTSFHFPDSKLLNGMTLKTSNAHLFSFSFDFSCSWRELTALTIVPLLGKCFASLKNTSKFVFQLRSLLCDVTKQENRAHKIQPIRFVFPS